MNPPTDVLICGAGAAGLTLAIELARRGVRFRLIEKATAPFHGSRGKGIQPRSQEIFEDLGLLDRLHSIGGLYPPSRNHHQDGSYTDTDMVRASPPTPAEPYTAALMVPQFLTESVMRQRLQELGHAPGFGHELVAFEQDESGVTAKIATAPGEETVRARYLVGADGGRSFVRRSLGIGFPGETLGVRAVVADLLMTGLDRHAWHQFNASSPDQRVLLCPLSGTDLFQLQAPIPLDGDVDLDAAGLTALLHARTGRNDLIVHDVAWASAYQMNARLADSYRCGRIFLVGDAAHAHPPTGGQGLNTSVQDAYNLGWKLSAVLRGAPAALLDSYEEERRPIAASMLGLSTRLLENAQRGDHRRGREVQQLDIGYPTSPLALRVAGRTSGPGPGDRAPDARLQGAAGQPRRLFDLLRGPHWTLFGYQADASAAPIRAGLHVHVIGPGEELRDEEMSFVAAYAPSPGDWVLVRPDGYIAAHVPTAQLAALDPLLEMIQQP